MAAGRSKRRQRPHSRQPDPLADLEEAEAVRGDLAPSCPSRTARSSALRGTTRGEWTKLRSAGRALAAFGQVASTIVTNVHPSSLMARILDVAIETLGAERGILFLGKGDDVGLVPAMVRSIEGEELADLEKVSRTMLRLALDGRAIITPDAARDRRFRDVASIQRWRIRSVACVPLQLRGEAIGALYLDAPSVARAFTQEALYFLDALAGLAAAALETSRIHSDVVRENSRLRQRLASAESFARIVTMSPSMSALLQRAVQAIQVDASILIIGEPGTGKELLARIVHAAGSRARGPFITHSCAAFPGDLSERHFTGHTAGALTGPQWSIAQLFQSANEGVLFFDEIGELDADVQKRVLSAIKAGVPRRSGVRRSTRTDVGLIAATSRDLREDVRSGRFDKGLYYRISVLELSVPPLRERVEDIPLLVDHFVEKHGGREAGCRRLEFSPQALELLQGLPWPGNVAELENLVRLLLSVVRKRRVDPPLLRTLLGLGPDAKGLARSPITTPWFPVLRAAAEVKSLAEQRRDAIRAALTRTGGHKGKAARLLGMHRNTLYRLIRRLKREGLW